MDDARARTLLMAERDEVRNLLKDEETALREDHESEVDSEAGDAATRPSRWRTRVPRKTSPETCATGWMRSSGHCGG
jgi:hypothetical protein